MKNMKNMKDMKRIAALLLTLCLLAVAMPAAWAEDADVANLGQELLVEAREGIPLNKESFYETEAIISDAVKRGQHIYHIIQSNNLPTSKSSVYRHIKAAGGAAPCDGNFLRGFGFRSGSTGDI